MTSCMLLYFTDHIVSPASFVISWSDPKASANQLSFRFQSIAPTIFIYV